MVGSAEGASGGLTERTCNGVPIITGGSEHIGGGGAHTHKRIDSRVDGHGTIAEFNIAVGQHLELEAIDVGARLHFAPFNNDTRGIDFGVDGAISEAAALIERGNNIGGSCGAHRLSCRNVAVAGYIHRGALRNLAFAKIDCKRHCKRGVTCSSIGGGPRGACSYNGSVGLRRVH